MISYSVSSFLTGHIDVIQTPNFSFRVETNRKVLFLRQRRTSIYDITTSDWDSVSHPVAALDYSHGMDAKSLLTCHQNIVNFLDALGNEWNDFTLDEVFEMVSTSFSDYGEWQRPEKRS